MTDFLLPLFSKGMLVFAIILFILDMLSILYFQGFKSIWLVLVLEVAAIAAYVIAQNINNKDENIWNRGV